MKTRVQGVWYGGGDDPFTPVLNLYHDGTGAIMCIAPLSLEEAGTFGVRLYDNNGARRHCGWGNYPGMLGEHVLLPDNIWFQYHIGTLEDACWQTLSKEQRDILWAREPSFVVSGDVWDEKADILYRFINRRTLG